MENQSLKKSNTKHSIYKNPNEYLPLEDRINGVMQGYIHQLLDDNRTLHHKIAYLERKNRRHLVEIGEREKLENGLVAQKDLLRSVIENVNDGVIVCNKSRHFLLFNSKAESLLGNNVVVNDASSFCKIYKLIDRNTECILDLNKMPLEQALSGKKVIPVLVKQKQDCGEYKIYKLDATTIVYPNLSFEGAILVVQDITEKIKRQETLDSKHKEIIRSYNEMQKLANAVAHDLKEPLRSIVGFSQLLQDQYKSKLDENAGTYLHFIENSARQMSNIANDLLRFVQVDLKELQLENVKLNDEINSILNSFSTKISQKKVKFEIDCFPEIFTDPCLLKLILSNLIENAIKFSHIDPLIKISITRLKFGNEICIEDNGIGISEDYQSKVFSLFGQLLPKHKTSGTGIGLALCSKIVDKLNGRIWVESELGKGSKFKFYLPNLTEN